MERHSRLKKTGVITDILQNGKRLQGSVMNIYYIPADITAFAVLVKKKSGTAVQRNNIKRWVREAFRCESKMLPLSCSMIFSVDKPFAELDFHSIRGDIVRFIAELSAHTEASG